MHKKLLLSMLAAVAVTAAAQPKEGVLTDITRLTADAGVKFENPCFSPDGKQIAFTKFGYQGLYVINTDGTRSRQISDADGVGYMYQWGLDGAEILVRDTRWVANAGGGIDRAHAALAVSVADGTSVKLTADHADMQPAVWRYDMRGNASVVSDAEVVRNVATLAVDLNSAPQKQLAAYRTGFITDSEHLWAVDALGNKNMIYTGEAFEPKLSPDGNRVAFVDMFDNVKVMGIDGTGLQTVAKGFRPAWLNDGQLVIERTQDDGHTYTAGELVMVNLDTMTEKTLTATPGRIEMNPAVSPDGNMIVFTDFNDGQVYTAKIK